MSFELGEDGIEASAALNEVDLGAVVVSNAALALDVSTSAPPSFALSGDLEIPGFATATGSVELSASGFSFMVQVAEADDPAGDMVTISASAGFGTNGQPPSFKATLFVRLPSVDEVFRDVQDAYSDVQQFFTGSPTTHELSLRCLEVNVDLRVGMSSPLSGSVNAKVHLGWINKQNTFDSQGKVWQIGWNFDASLFDNGSNLLDSLSGATVPDTTGCRIPPSSFDIGQLARTVDDPYLFVTRPDGGTVAYQEYGERIWMRLGITLSDPAVYEVLMKTSTGLVLPPQEIRHTRIGPSSYSINVPAEWRIRESDVAPDTDGYGHASITAEIRVKGTTRVIAEDSQPLVLLDAGIVDHRIGGVPTRAEHQDQFVPVAWRQPFDMLRGGSVKSWFTLDDGFGPEKIPGTETNVSIPRVFSATEWLNRPLQTGGYAWLDIRAGGAVSPTQVLTHHLEYTNDSGQKQTSSTQLVVTVSDPTPQVSMVCVDVTCKTFATPVRPANRAGGIYTPRFLVAEPGQTLSVYVYDPGATVGNASTRESYNVSAAGQTKTISRQSGQEPASFPGAQVDFTLPAGLARGQTHVMKIAVACDGNGCPGSNTVEVSIVVPANRSVAAFTDAADGVSGPYSTATAFTGTPHPTTACGAVGFATGTALGPNSDIVQVRVVGAKRAEDGATVPMRIEGDGVTFTNGVATMLVTPGGSSVFRVYEDRPTAISDADCRFQAARFTSTFDLEVTRYPGPIPNDSYDQQKRLAFWDTANGGIDESTDVVDLAEASIDSFEQSNTPSCWTDGAQHTAFYWTSSLNVDNLRLLVSAVSLEGADLQVAVFEAPPPSPGKLEPVTREIGCSNSASQAMTLADAGPYGAQSADVVVKATSMMVIVVDTQGDPGPAMIRVRQLVAEPIAVTGTSAVVRTDTGLGVNDVAAIAECGTGSTAGAVTWTAPFTSTITIGASGGAASSALGVSRVGSDAFSFGWPTKNLSGFDPLGCVASVTSAPQQNRQVSVVEGQTYMFTVVSPPGSPAMTLTFTETGERFIKGKFVDLQGYWMVDETGYVYAFGDSETVVPTGTRATVTSRAVKVLENPSGAGIWILESNGVVHALGGAPHYGNVNLAQLSNGEVPSTMAATPGGLGYYVFTSKGRALTFGNATHFGDLVTIGLADALRGPVVDSASLQDGRGYYMVGSDGGIFTFGDAVFAGSVPQVVPGPLDSPVNGLVVDPDGSGYWLVAGDGGVFAFDAPFRGSIPGVLPPGTKLNQPINGMVPYGNGYLMVAGDGGIFNFSNLAFLGSLGDRQIPSPIVAVAPVPR
ncbi:MAG: hypothetical protein KDB16_19195 [Acidimicrobiales bacterium]|nr:hypothetical protein [Acidimicrobiales bacterium]